MGTSRVKVAQGAVGRSDTRAGQNASKQRERSNATALQDRAAREISRARGQGGAVDQRVRETEASGSRARDDRSEGQEGARVYDARSDVRN